MINIVLPKIAEKAVIEAFTRDAWSPQTVTLAIRGVPNLSTLTVSVERRGVIANVSTSLPDTRTLTISQAIPKNLLRNEKRRFKRLLALEESVIHGACLWTKLGSGLSRDEYVTETAIREVDTSIYCYMMICPVCETYARYSKPNLLKAVKRCHVCQNTERKLQKNASRERKSL